MQTRSFYIKNYHSNLFVSEPKIDLAGALKKQSQGKKITELEKGAISSYEQRTRQQRQDKKIK